MAMIMIPVDEETARIYESASEQEKAKFQLKARLMIRDMKDKPQLSLSEVMDRISAQAKANGLTPEILEAILNDDSDDQ